METKIDDILKQMDSRVNTFANKGVNKEGI